MDVLGELAEPFERMTPADASALLAEHYALEPLALERLDTERDDSFRVTTADGDHVLKVAHPADDPLVIDLQVEAMAHTAIADPGIPIQRLVPSAHGERVPIWNGRFARLLTWLEGEPMFQPGEDQLVACGAMLGRVSSALREFGHPAAGRELPWDLQRLPRLRPYARDALTLGVILRFEQVVAPALHELPHQVIHNDFHPGNVLVDPSAAGYVTGVLDFGDIVHTARVCDLGVALAYLVPADGAVWPAVQPFIDGYESVVPLLPEERAIVPDLVAARLVQRVVIPGELARDDLAHAIDANVRLLRHVLEES